MALKPDRDVKVNDISFFVAAITYGGNKGGVVVATGAGGSGAAMDQTANACWYIANPSGKRAVGLLDTDVVNVDLTRQKLNPYKPEAQVGDKVTLIKQGYVVTNMIDSAAATISYGVTAYLAGSGYLTPTNATGRPVVGKFLSKKDEDGFAKVWIDL